MKNLKSIILLLIFASSNLLFSQSIDVERVITTNFPTLRAEFRVKDANGDEVRNLNNTDFELKDLGNIIPFTSPTCPPDQARFSLILVFDASGSMENNISNETKTPPIRIDVIKNVAKKFIDQLPEGQFEATLGFFTKTFRQFDVKDFTTDKDALKADLNMYQPGGGTNYNAAFLGYRENDEGGAFALVKKAQYKPVIIFMNDGYHQENIQHNEFQTGTIINKALATNTTIFSLTIGPIGPNPDDSSLDLNSKSKLRDISNTTGGKYFENLLNEGQIQDIYSQILQSAKGFGTPAPCFIDFESDCNDGEIELTYKGFALPVSDTMVYTIADELKPNLDITSRTFLEINPTLNQPKVVDVILKAEKNKLTITGFNATPANIFTVSDWGGSAPPFTLQKGETRNIKVRITPTNREFYPGTITFEGTGCSGLEMKPRAGFIFAEDIVFANVNQGDQETNTFTQKFCNLTDEPININSISVTGGTNSTDFGITSQNTTLAPGECLDIEATFRPSDQGDREATYTVKTNKGEFVAALKGGGAGKPQISATAPKFADVNCTNAKSSIIVEVKNDGPVDLTISNIALQDATHFTYTGPATLVVLAKSSNIIDVTVDFTPQAIGVQSTNLVFTNDSDNNPYSVLLEGEMLKLDYSTSKTNLDFVTICANPGQPITLELDLTNLSSFGYKVNAVSNIPQFKTNLPIYDLTSGTSKVIVSFEATANNTFNGIITFTSECGNVVKIINVVGRINSPEVVDLTTIINAVVGSSQTNQVDIINPNTAPFDVVDAFVGDLAGNPMPEFSVGSTAFTVPGSDKFVLDVTYTPNPANPVQISGLLYLVVVDPCDVTLKNIKIDGKPDLSVAELIVDNRKDYIGNITMIGAVLSGTGPFLTSGTDKVVYTLQYDNTLLEPQSGTKISANEVSFTISLPSPTPGFIAVSSLFKVLNGLPTTFSDLIVTKVEALNNANEPTAGVNVTNGRFSLILADGKVETYNMAASPGDEFEIALDIKDDNNNLDKILHKDLRVKLEYNFTVMQPKDGKFTILSADRAEMDITASIDYSKSPKENQTQATLGFAKIPMIAKLGNAQTSPVTIKSVEVLSDGVAEFALDTATFTLTGICEEGGNLRLFTLSELMPSINVLENPMQSNTEVTMTTIEKGTHKVTLLDVKGNKTIVDSRNVTTEGSYIISLEVDKLLSGVYFIQYETPTQKFFEKFIILK